MHEGRYMPLIESGELSIDEEGRIWRHKVHPGGHSPNPLVPISRRRAEHKDTKGYLLMKSRINKRRYSCEASRIIWVWFNDIIPDKMQINHINGIRDDNRPCNLEVVTASQNIRHSIDILGSFMGVRGEDSPWSKLKEIEVLEIRSQFSKGMSKTEISRAHKIHFNTVHSIIIRRTWKHIQ